MKAERTRLDIISELGDGTRSAAELADALGMSLRNVQHRLADLREDGRVVRLAGRPALYATDARAFSRLFVR